MSSLRSVDGDYQIGNVQWCPVRQPPLPSHKHQFTCRGALETTHQPRASDCPVNATAPPLSMASPIQQRLRATGLDVEGLRAVMIPSLLEVTGAPVSPENISSRRSFTSAAVTAGAPAGIAAEAPERKGSGSVTCCPAPAESVAMSIPAMRGAQARVNK
jgi:hypothetical protein